MLCMHAFYSFTLVTKQMWASRSLVPIPLYPLSLTFSDLRLVSSAVASCNLYNCLPETKKQTFFSQMKVFMESLPSSAMKIFPTSPAVYQWPTRLTLLSAKPTVPLALLPGSSQLSFVHLLASASWTSFLLTLPCLPTWYVSSFSRYNSRVMVCTKLWFGSHHLCSPNVSHNILYFLPNHPCMSSLAVHKGFYMFFPSGPMS